MTPALLLPLGLAPLSAQALGLGALHVSSALGQPLAARIELVGATAAEAELARISLASTEVHQRMGVDGTLGGVALRFAVKVGNDGRSYVSVSSFEPVREPYLDFVVEAVSPSGQVARHYTILLDPVGAPATPVAATGERAWSPLVTPIPQRTVPSRPRYNPFANVGLPKAGATYGPVPPGTTLWAIARRVQPAGAGLDAVMSSIVRANPQAFINGDPARLKAGVKLAIPDANGLREGAAPVPAAETSQPASTPAAVAEPAPETPKPADAGGAAATPAPEAEVRVLRGEDAKPPAAAAVPTAGGDRVQLLEEALDAAQQQNEALQRRLGALEDQLKTLSDLVRTGPEGHAAGATDANGASAAAGASPAQRPAVPSAATAPPASRPAAAVESAREGGMPAYVWAAVAGLGLGGLLLWMRRRRASATVAMVDDSPAEPAPPVEPRGVPSPPATHVEWVEAEPARPVAPAPTMATDTAPDSGFGDPVDTQIDLLTAYVGMADGPSARQVYDEIQRTGTPAQKAQARALLARLDA